MNILLKNGFVIDPANMIEERLDLLIAEGKIAQFIKPGDQSFNAKVIDVSGKWIVPGLIDMHVHLREPGFEYKETITTGMAAAQTGGFTSVCCMPNTNPVNDDPSVTRFIHDKAQEGSVHVFPIGAITKGSLGKELADLQALHQAGCVGFSDDGKPVMDSDMMQHAMREALKLGLLIISHCEDTGLVAGGVMHDGVVARKLGLKGIPAEAEETMVAREIALAQLTGCRVHIAHVSTEGSVQLVRDAKANGISITAETCPHYFTLTDEAVLDHGTLAKMNPPLRTANDVAAIKQGLKDGTIDVIATDHAPHAEYEKAESFSKAPFGIVGLETCLGLAMKLVEERILSRSDMIAKMTINPAKVLRLHKGTLTLGADADITIIDPEKKWVVDASKFKSKSHNTPFNGWNMTGKAVFTMRGGAVFADSIKD
ncbi:MAG: dihydroorotase [Nitrospirota bacterium]